MLFFFGTLHCFIVFSFKKVAYGLKHHGISAVFQHLYEKHGGA